MMPDKVGLDQELDLQPASIDIWDKKYRLKKKDGTILDETVDDSFKRIARALSKLETDSQHWYKQFLWALRNGAIPAGRIFSNAGAENEKPNTSLINCTVSDTIPDSMEGILTKVTEAGITLAAGCGIGYEFSTLRPKGAYVAGVGASTSGAISFMNIYNEMCFTVASAGGRRGAQMGTLDISHPDIFRFIKAKRENGVLRQFNLSVLITEAFMKAVKNNEEWKLVFPANVKEISKLGKVLEEPEFTLRDWPYVADNMAVCSDTGKVWMRVYEVIKAKDLWDLIMKSTYDFAEPGFILIDQYNNMNNNWFCENIRATNPCGEQGLPPYGACLLGSINLTKFVVKPFHSDAYFDWEKYKKVISIFTRMLDNVADINGLPLPEQREEILRKRRHGMGFLGLGSTLTMLNKRYGSASSIDFTEQVSRQLAIQGWKAGVELAKEKGPAPIFNEVFTLKEEPGKSYTGKELFVQSQYMARIFKVLPFLKSEILEHGCRFTHHSSIAPTGTISLSIANNASNGIEPTFAHKYTRNIIREGLAAKEAVEVLSYEALLLKHLAGEEIPETEAWQDSSKVTPEEHINIQAAAQYWIDSSISKTANVPTDIKFEDFENIYMAAWEKGLKGCTTFRFNPEAFQGVLVTEKDLTNTTYEFTLESGEKIQAKGNEIVEYEGKEYSAANLFDALKEGYYGKL